MFDHIKFIYIAPVGLEMPASIVEEVAATKSTIDQVTTMSLEEAVKISNVLYVTRIQKERFASEVYMMHC